MEPLLTSAPLPAEAPTCAVPLTVVATPDRPTEIALELVPPIVMVPVVPVEVPVSTVMFPEAKAPEETLPVDTAIALVAAPDAAGVLTITPPKPCTVRLPAPVLQVAAAADVIVRALPAVVAIDDGAFPANENVPPDWVSAPSAVKDLPDTTVVFWLRLIAVAVGVPEAPILRATAEGVSKVGARNEPSVRPTALIQKFEADCWPAIWFWM